jgi:hypothetical protein
MRMCSKFMLIFILIFCANAVAQTDLAGTWQGKLIMSPAEKITIQFIFTKQPNGSYKAVLNSPDEGAIRNVAASAVKYAGGKLSVEVTSLSGSYSGTAAKGVLTGEWKQPGSVLPLVLTPYVKPGVSILKPLLGEWVGALDIPEAGNKLSIVFRFVMSKDGKISGYLDVPDQNGKDIPVGDVTLDGNQVDITVPSARIGYSGKLAGNKINGLFKQNGRELKLDLVKGKYEPPPTFVNLSPEGMQQLTGQWLGKWKVSEEVSYTAIFRFEKSKIGKFFAVIDLPEQGMKGISLADGVLKGGQLACRIPIMTAEYAGKISGNAITGTLKMAGKQYPLNLLQGAKYEPPATQIDIPADAMKGLLGKWSGKIGNVTLVIRFERTPAGKNAVYIDSPEQSMKGMPVIKASVADDKLVLKFKEDQYSGKINGNKIDGTLSIGNGQANVPVSVTKQ